MKVQHKDNIICIEQRYYSDNKYFARWAEEDFKVPGMLAGEAEDQEDRNPGEGTTRGDKAPRRMQDEVRTTLQQETTRAHV